MIKIKFKQNGKKIKKKEKSEKIKVNRKKKVLSNFKIIHLKQKVCKYQILNFKL